MAKVITLKQPWAQLVVKGCKQWETRGWNTNYRGELFIHSSAHFHFSDLELVQLDEDFKACIGDPHTLRMGYILGKVELVEVRRVEEAMDIISRCEMKFGNYMPNRYAWKLENPVMFQNPIWVMNHSY